MDKTTRFKVPIIKATRKNVTPFGQLLAAPSDLGAASPFYGDAVHIHSIPGFVCEDADLVVATLKKRPMEVRFLERHGLHTQTFLPIGRKPFVVLMAPPTADRALPNLKDLAALRFDGTVGFVMHRGTWHEFPFAMEDDTEIAVVLSKSARSDLSPSNVHENEAHGPDLDKRDVVSRLGTIIELSP